MAYRRPRPTRQPRRQVRALPPWPVLGVGALAAAAIILGAAFLARGGITGGPPGRGDHWHSVYDVVLCGERLPNFPVSPNVGIHTHGDGIIHTHPGGPDQTGRNANLGRFFSASGVQFRQGYLRLPDGREFKDGNPCPEGPPGALRLLVNGLESPEFERYVPLKGDLVRVEFR